MATARGVHTLSVAVLAFMLTLTGVSVAVTTHLVAAEEHKLLVQRTQEVAVVFSSALSDAQTELQALERAAAEPNGRALFISEAVAEAGSSGGQSEGFALARPVGSRWVISAAAGAGLRAGEFVAPPVAATLSAAARAAAGAEGSGGGPLVPTPVFGAGSGRSVGLAVGGPDGSVVYRQTTLGKLKSPQQAGSAPFSEIRIILYAVDRPVDSQAIFATGGSLSLRHDVYTTPIRVGTSKWLLVVSPERSLAGAVADFAPYLALVVGVIASVLLFGLIEFVIRRRDAALALYEVERHFAESLQKRLLPELPAVAGLDVAWRYVTASNMQEVGGDWFDMFDIADGRTGVVIGDVMGHDADAAAAMAQVRAALRAYAVAVPNPHIRPFDLSPAPVVEWLGAFVEQFDIASVVTVVYGVLDPPAADGSRRFSWVNAGHLPPLLQHPSGNVTVLTDGTVPLLGAPRPKGGPPPPGTVVLPAGALLVLYTDGLVEVREEVLDVSIARLADRLRTLDPCAPSHRVCEDILRQQVSGERSDDVALVVLRVGAGGSDARPAPVDAARQA